LLQAGLSANVTVDTRPPDRPLAAAGRHPLEGAVSP